MNAVRNSSRRARTTARAAVIAAAVAAMGTVGMSGASATPTAGTHSGTGPILVKEIRTAHGVAKLFEEAGRPQGSSTSVRAATMRPDSGGGCNGSNPEVCFSINGSGYYVNWMQNGSYYPYSGDADMQIKSPSGADVVDSGTFYAYGGNWYYLTWYPYSNVSGGWWCGYSNQNGGWYTGECLDVS